jgi:hypothetical protein
MLTDNKIYELGSNDVDAIFTLLKEFNGDYDIPGYDAEVLSQLLVNENEIAENLKEYGKMDTIPVEDPNSWDKAGTIPPVLDDAKKKAICPECGAVFWF